MLYVDQLNISNLADWREIQEYFSFISRLAEYQQMDFHGGGMP